MSDWAPVQLGDVVDIFDYKRVPLSSTQRSSRQGQYPYYGAQGVIDTIDDFIFDGRFILVPEDGENLRSRKLPIAYFAEGRFWVNNHAHILKAKGNVADDRFVQSAIEASDIGAWVTGAAQPKLSQANLRQIPVALPSLAEQRAVASILDALDEMIANNRRRAEVLEKMARAIYREWFVRFRFPGHESGIVVESPVGPIPDGWEPMAASRALVINPPVKIDRSTAQPFITMGDLSERSMVCFPSDRRAGSSGAKFVNGDRLFARITPCLENGKTGFVQCLERDQAGRGSTEFVVLRGAAVGAAYAYCLARSDEFRSHAIRSMSGASGRQRVRNECFDSFLLAVPPLALVILFEQVAASLFETVRSLSVQQRRLFPSATCCSRSW